MKYAVIAVALLALSGCAQLAGWNDRAEAVTNLLVSRAGDVGLKLMHEADALEEILVRKIGRLRASDCLHSLAVIREYALETPEQHAAILRDCHLDVQVSTDVLLTDGVSDADLIGIPE